MDKLVLELQDEDMKWILQKRSKHIRFIMVFAGHEENLKKLARFFPSCNPFPS